MAIFDIQNPDQEDCSTRVSSNSPLVSCLMVSRGRIFPACWAVECFIRQTYQNRELVILVDEPECELISYVQRLNDPRISLFELTTEQRTLEELRNISVSYAKGEYVCQWDDDDLYAPERIDTQLSSLRASTALACVLSRWTLWWPAKNKLAISGYRHWEGSMLARKQDMLPYPALRRGEDTQMLNALSRKGRFIAIDAPYLYLYVHHGNNTFAIQHFIDIYSDSSQRWVGDRYRERFADLAGVLPILSYESDLRRLPGNVQNEPRAGVRESRLVSIIVRSMGRPELRQALESIAAQEYPLLDVIVVDATGGQHPPLPNIVWREGHSVRLISAGRQLLRPHAANVGLEAIHGEWFGFLDDDDTFEPDHVSELILAAEANSSSLVVYSVTRILGTDGRVVSLLGLPFNRALMFHGPLFTFPAALIRRGVLQLGCRFDENMEICEDRDFFWQISQHGDFHFHPLATVNYCPDVGTSGTGQGANRNPLRFHRYDSYLRAKWFGEGAYHYSRALWFVNRGRAAFFRGRTALARDYFEATLHEYPDDPNALNGLGYLLTDLGEYDRAERLLLKSIGIHPSAGEYRLALARLFECSGRNADAREQALVAYRDSTVRSMASAMLERLGGLPATPEMNRRIGTSKQSAVSRLALCSCGSGKRYKHCCGRQDERAVVTPPAERQATEILELFGRGEAEVAVTKLATFPAMELVIPATALACGDVLTEMANFELAYEFYQQACKLGASAQATKAVVETCNEWFRAERRQSMRQVLDKRVAELNCRVAHAHLPPIEGTPHIICPLGKIGGAEHQALALYVLLSGVSPVQLWSTVPPCQAFLDQYPINIIDSGAGAYPESGHLIFIGTGFDYSDWLERSKPNRVTVCVNSDSLVTLIEQIVLLEAINGAFYLDFTFTSDFFRNLFGLPGAVEYPGVDLNRFRPVNGPNRSGKFVIGRHSPDHRLKFHPNDPSFYRALARNGHQVRILGGSNLNQALDHDAQAYDITLYPEAGEGVREFLAELDCFIYRTHPLLVEPCGTVVLEAMAMALPVVLFADRQGAAELIEHGRNGFLVYSEAEALQCIDKLVVDPDLRRRLGREARTTIERVMAEQGRALPKFYCGEPKPLIEDMPVAQRTVTGIADR